MSKTGEFVFPINALGNVGLTKHEYFAGLAMQGLLTRNEGNPQLCVSESKRIAEESVIMADELLEELEKRK